MADVERRMDALIDPPLAPPPPLDDIRDRAARHRRRRRLGGLAVGVPVLAVVAGLAVLVPGGDVAVRTVPPAAGPGQQTATTPVPAVEATAPVEVLGPSPPGTRPPDPTPVLLTSIGVGAQTWELKAERVRERICVALSEAGTDHGRGSCWEPEAVQPLVAGVLGANGVYFVYGMARRGVAAVRIELPDGSTTEMPTASHPQFEVVFFATTIPTPNYASVTAVG